MARTKHATVTLADQKEGSSGSEELHKIKGKRKAMDDAEEYPRERYPKKQRRTKAPPPGFVQYLDDFTKKYTNLFPGTKARLIATNAIYQWKKLSKREKAPFESMAEDEKQKSEVVEAAIANFGNRHYDLGPEDLGSESDGSSSSKSESDGSSSSKSESDGSSSSS